MPVANYASEIWGYKDFQCCRNIQNRAMRYYLGVHKFAPIAGMQGDLGWLSVKYVRYKYMVNFWNRLVKMEDDRLTKHIFKYDYELCRGNWSADMNKIFSLLNMHAVFENIFLCNVENALEQLVYENNRQWNEIVHSKPKLRTYFF